MNYFKYETHLHTSEGSACAKSTGAKMVDFYKANGYNGFVVTDHFFNGNTAVDRSLPWEKKIDDFFKGYESAKKRGDEVDFDVFFGFEFNNEGTEFLIYGLDRQWLKDNEIIMFLDTAKALDFMRRAGAMIIHAHPFRKASYIPALRTFPKFTDAVEVYNGCNLDAYNQQAEEYALTYNLPFTSGSDIHSVEGRICAGICLSKRASTINDLISAILEQKCTVIGINNI